MLIEKRTELAMERKGYLRQAARGVLSDEELDNLLAGVDEQRESRSLASLQLWRKERAPLRG